MNENIVEEYQKKTQLVFRTNCKFCNQEIRGSSKSQVEYLLLQHKMAKHKDKFEIKEKKK